MLSQTTIAIVKSTTPILEEHGETLTRHFYKRMFAANPEVIEFFNPAHQTSGSQQRALAGAICAYAANIDNLDVLSGAVELIAQKHASLQIKPEHYPIVGANLLASIREVLGEGATEEVINAWSDAYGLLANILIGHEAAIYQDQKDSPHGWEGFKKFNVVKKVKESDIITSFYLAPADGEPVAPFKPGQYITVRMPTPCGHSTMRNYSISNKPGEEYYRISVKREAGTPSGYVSNMLHEKIECGSTLELAPPCGEFFLDLTISDPRPLILLAGGIGITPLMSMLESTVEHMPDRKIIFVHACLNESVQAFKGTLDDLMKKHPSLTVHHYYSDTNAFTTNALSALTKPYDGDYYFCGPKPFMIEIYHHLFALGVPSTHMHYEFFGPKETFPIKP